MMSFKAPEKSATAQKYAYDQTIDEEENRWVLIEGLEMDNTSTPADNTYRCEASLEKCSGVFNTAPTSSSDTPDSDIVSGDFSLN